MTVFCEKIPQIAIEAFDQFIVLDRSFRTRYYYLGRLESEMASSINEVEETLEQQTPDPVKERERSNSIRRGMVDLINKKLMWGEGDETSPNLL